VARAFLADWAEQRKVDTSRRTYQAYSQVTRDFLESLGERTVSYRYGDRIAVASPTEMEIAPGDRLQLKANGRSIEGARLHNGELVTVVRVPVARQNGSSSCACA
jgi:hypothetical protein